MESRRRKHNDVTTSVFGRSNDVGNTTLWQLCDNVIRRCDQKTIKTQRCYNVVCQLGQKTSFLIIKYILTLVIRLQHVLKMFSRRLAKTYSIRIANRLQEVFKTTWRRLEDILKTSSRHLQDILPKHLQGVSQRYLQDMFKTSSKCIIVLNCSC